AGLAALAGVVVLLAARVRLVAPEPTLLLRDAHGRFLAEVPDARDAEVGYWPLARLRPRVVAATLAVEDRRFWRHPGVDPLAATPQAPARMNPYRAPGRTRAAERGRRVLDALLAAHVLGGDEYDLAVRQLAALRIPPLGRRPPEALHAVLHLERLFRHGAVPPAPLIDTTLDLDVQQAVATMVADALAGL